MTKNFIIIAVDGGAAAGKSSTSRALSEKFNLLHVDTGAHYRTVTLALKNAGISPSDTSEIKKQLATLPLDTTIFGHTARLAINKVIPDDAELRTPEINTFVSAFAALPQIRQFLFNYQRSQVALAHEKNFSGIIMEGRDIGSVILPDANLKIFLEADTSARNARREAEGRADSISQRDKTDSSRKVAPLKIPNDAIRIDSTHLSLEEVVEKISSLVRSFLEK